MSQNKEKRFDVLIHIFLSQQIVMAANGSEKRPQSASLPDLSGFQFDRILSDYPEDKKVVVCGKIVGKGNDDATAIVVVEKLPFAADKVMTYLDGNMKMKEQFQNDVYSMHHAHQTSEAANQVK